MEAKLSRKQHVKSFQEVKKAKIVNQQQVQLPSELVTVILELLPVKSLLRFKCVSKWWYNLIKTDPVFAINQLKHGRRYKSRMLLVLMCRPLNMSFHDLGSPELKEVQRPNLSIPNYSGKYIQYLNCLGGLWSNGIVCIVYGDCITLCNPALREFKSLPPRPRDASRYVSPDCFCGFGITCTGEFKVIIIERKKSVISKQSLPAHLYSTSTDSWKQVCDSPGKLYNIHHQLYFNGACHWFGGHDNVYIIQAFNMSTEVFMQLKLPDGVSNHLDFNSRLIVINDCLSVVHREPGVFEHGLDFWVMKEYGIKESWSKQYVIQPETYMIPFLSWKNDEWLLMERNHQLASISFLTDEIIVSQVRFTCINSLLPFAYQESLIRLNNNYSTE